MLPCRPIKSSQTGSQGPLYLDAVSETHDGQIHEAYVNPQYPQCATRPTVFYETDREIAAPWQTMKLMK